MKEWLIFLTENAIILIDFIALIVILYGTLAAFASAVRIMLRKPTEYERRTVWLVYARWLVAGLTFALAADIIETSITTDWTAIGRIAAIALIRTFLNFFLARDFVEVREWQESERGVAEGER
ncbi:MAG TPA: DUF1622 domain-containing protein [Rhodanobacteraceae bacterium]|nr:DUF1622 domain-containing protein [Rhodanobacteraceae bacterium]